MFSDFKMIKFLANFLFLLIFGTFIFCTIEKPQAPEWEVPLNIPITNTTYTAADLADDFSELKILYDNTLGFSLNDQIDTVFINDLSIANQKSFSSSVEVGNFTLNIDETVRDSTINLGLVWPPAQQNTGAVIPIPAFSFHQMTIDELSFDEFEYIDIVSGMATISITNRFPFPLGPLNVLVRDANQNLIAQIYFTDNIERGSTASQTVDLAGMQISNELEAEISGQSVGTNGETVLIDPEDDILFQVSFGELTISRAKARIEPINIYTSETIELLDDYFISSAIVKSGELHITLKNNIPLAISLSLEFPEITTQIGMNLKKSYEIPSNSEINSILDLSGFRISLPRQSREFTVLVNARFENNGSAFTEISHQDQIEYSFQINNFSVRYFRGIVAPTTLEIPSTTTHVDLPSDLDRLQFQNASLTLNFHNRIDFPLNLSIALKGSNANGNAVSLPVDVSLEPSGRNTENLTTITLDKNNSAIVDFINNLPTRIEITGTAEFGDGISIGTVSSSDYIFVDYQIEAPFNMSFEEQTIYPDTSEIIILPKDFPSNDFNGKSTIDGELTENLQRGEIQLTIHNHFPVGTQLKINVSETVTSLNTAPSLLLGPFDISKGQIDETGQVKAASTTNHQITLSAEQMLLFKNTTESPKSLYFQPEIKLAATEHPVLLRANDFITIISVAKFNLLLSSD